MICIYIYIVCILVICILYGRYCRHCLICRLLLYNNFKKGVMSRVNVCLTFRMLFYFRGLVASYYRCCQGGVALRNGNILDYWSFAARYCFKYDL